jgi:hypothetical protein
MLDTRWAYSYHTPEAPQLHGSSAQATPEAPQPPPQHTFNPGLFRPSPPSMPAVVAVLACQRRMGGEAHHSNRPLHGVTSVWVLRWWRRSICALALRQWGEAAGPAMAVWLGATVWETSARSAQARSAPIEGWPEVCLLLGLLCVSRPRASPVRYPGGRLFAWSDNGLGRRWRHRSMCALALRHRREAAGLAMAV